MIPGRCDSHLSKCPTDLVQVSVQMCPYAKDRDPACSGIITAETVVLTIVESLSIEADNLTAIRHVPQTIAVDDRR